MSTPTQPDLSRFLATTYDALKALHPGEGRRKWRLRAAAQFWALSAVDKAAYAQLAPLPEEEADEASFSTDDDPLDDQSTYAAGLGVLVRTDFAADAAWEGFLTRLRDAEAEYAAGIDTPMATEDRQDDDEDEDEDEDDAATGGADASGPPPIIHILDPPPSSPLRALLSGGTNLTALRLLNDVNVRRVPDPPAGTKRVSPPNRLVDYHGWQEVYAGRLVWVYDRRSNTDQCARLVSQQSASLYGTATADSWRARVSHLCELQVNLVSGAMSIDFGGMDRWDYPERVRNIAEAEESGS